MMPTRLFYYFLGKNTNSVNIIWAFWPVIIFFSETFFKSSFLLIFNFNCSYKIVHNFYLYFF
ncbi:unnamed protein product [Meloidogyne enterolobii]|uniref:Uncharacterized protein n=1 Tax=Meloidogyne enterolobii TaxID=390850 RepID=A0ACB0Y3X7_MELEN